ncbi:GPI-anchored wall transfer protein [Umbelopsis sp. PMI_123]|nr:GPI-anchored wall transfer protein [Umbelopsis sp. PMI_123]
MPMTDDEYKLEQEKWVSNCTGGSLTEINQVSASLACSYLLWACLQRKVDVDSHLAQFAILILPILACQTVLADYVLLVNLSLLTASTVLYLSPNTRATATTIQSSIQEKKHKNFLSVYRATMMVMTCIAILAVDFPIFPRRFAKVETFGTSLMDLGVGAFVFSSGVVSGRAYANPSGNGSHTALGRNFIRSLRASFPLLALGFIRMVATKGVNYQEHNSEYGLHWNFFFTLGFLPPFTAVASSLSKYVPFSLLGLSTAIAYQVALAHGLQEWALFAPRVDLISANKEGICSFFGYFSIFLFGLDAGTLIFSPALQNTRILQVLGKRDKSQQSGYGNLARVLGFWSVIYYVLFILFMNVIDGEGGQQVSRRIANLPYVLWVVAFNFGFILIFAMVDNGFSQSNSMATVPKLLESINVNGLVIFLVANLLTGLVNISMRTLYASTAISFTVCAMYMFIVTKFAWILWYQLQVRIKL